jgi:hypothetical protein
MYRATEDVGNLLNIYVVTCVLIIRSVWIMNSIITRMIVWYVAAVVMVKTFSVVVRLYEYIIKASVSI